MSEPGLAGKFGRMAQQIEKELQAKHYDWIVVQGDTATAAAAAAAGFLNHVPVAHVEAGLRTGDMYSPSPEEYNRRVVALSCTLHFAPTTASRDNLIAEAVPAKQVLNGNTVVDALIYTRQKLGAGYQPIDPAVGLLPTDKKLVLATLHRRENIGDPIRNVLRALRHLGEPAVTTPSPCPCTSTRRFGRRFSASSATAPNVHLLSPLQYPDFVHLLRRAWTVVSNSGSVQEEAPTFGLQILITRETTERPSALRRASARSSARTSTPSLPASAVEAGDRPQLLAAKTLLARAIRPSRSPIV